MTTVSKGMNDFVALTTQAYDNMHALVSSYVSAGTKCHAAAWHGLEDITHNLGDLGKFTLSRAINAGNTLMAAQTPQQAAVTQHAFIKDCLEGLVAGGNKLSEISTRTAKDMIDPLAQHANDAFGDIVVKQPRLG